MFSKGRLEQQNYWPHGHFQCSVWVVKHHGHQLDMIIYESLPWLANSQNYSYHTSTREVVFLVTLAYL